MTLIDSYIAGYERQFDYWASLAARARDLVEEEVHGSGIRAIVTSRAKSIDRLRMKLVQRSRTKDYQCHEDIERDIVDRAGVRVALYFPSQQAEVEKIIGKSFNVVETKNFPDPAHERPGAPRFTGYRATHYRCTIMPERLADPDKRYLSGVIEIQVASVLMHAWSEVEHDLVYKPLDGGLSDTEYSLLDQLNGLVQSGEIALEELLKAGDARLAAEESPFRSHYELGEYLRSQEGIKNALVKESDLGSIDVLFDFLQSEGINRGSAIARFLEDLDDDFEKRPLADQLSDLIIAGDKRKYQEYRRARLRTRNHLSNGTSASEEDGHYKEVGKFILAWAEFEGRIQDFSKRVEAENVAPRFTSVRRGIDTATKLGAFTPEESLVLIDLMHARNRMLHGRSLRPFGLKPIDNPVRKLKQLGLKLQSFKIE